MNKENLLAKIKKDSLTSGYNIILVKNGGYHTVYCKESTLSYLLHNNYKNMFSDDSRELYTYLKNDSLALIREWWKDMKLPSFGKHIWKIDDEYSVVRMNFAGQVFKYAIYLDLFLTLNSITRCYSAERFAGKSPSFEELKDYVVSDKSGYGSFNYMIEAIKLKTEDELKDVTFDNIFRQGAYGGHYILGSMSAFENGLLFNK